MSGSDESIMVASSSFLCLILWQFMFSILMLRACLCLGPGPFAVRFGDDVASGGPTTPGSELDAELSGSWADELEDVTDSERAL